MVDEEGYRHTHRIFNTYCLFMATINKRTCLNITLCTQPVVYVTELVFEIKLRGKKRSHGLCLLSQLKLHILQSPLLWSSKVIGDWTSISPIHSSRVSKVIRFIFFAIHRILTEERRTQLHVLLLRRLDQSLNFLALGQRMSAYRHIAPLKKHWVLR